MPNRESVNLPIMAREASLRAESFNSADRTIEIVWTTGATVRRFRWEGWEDLVEFEESLDVSDGAMRLERMNSGAPFLDSHRTWGGLNTVLGVIVPGSIKVEGGRGMATVRLTEAEDVAPLVQRIIEGTVRSVSVGYRVYEYQITKRDGELEHWRAVDWEPHEVSAVAMPADIGAQIRSENAGRSVFSCSLVRAQGNSAAGAAKSKENDMRRNNPGADENGQVRGQTDGTAADTPEAPAPATPAPEPGGSDENGRTASAAVAQERLRASTIQSLCRRHGLEVEFADDLIARGVSLDAARAAVLDHLADGDALGSRSHEPSPARARADGSRDAGYRSALETAMLHRESVRGVEMTDDAREFRGMTMMEMARHALERAGVSTRGMGRLEIAGAALGQRSPAYHTTGDFPAVLGNIGNRVLRTAYDDTPRTFTAWARRASLSDFRPTTRVQVSNAPRLEKVLEGAEFTYGTFGEASTQYALATYGRIIAFSRQMLINDDLGAFTRVANSFGARAAQLEGDLVYAILLQNPAMSDGTALFHADHGNLGAAAVINEVSLTSAMTAFAKQTDIDGTAIDVSPQFIIVPPGQRALEARKLLTATTPGKTDDVNTYAGQLQVVSERRLMPTTGAAPWFLAAGTGLIDTVEYAYLDGEDGVFTDTRNGFDIDGVEVKARLDFAASAIDHRGLYKNAGA